MFCYLGLTKIPENDLYAPSSPPHKLTTSKLERHNNLYSHSGGSTSRSRDGRSESNMTSKSGKIFYFPLHSYFNLLY